MTAGPVPSRPVSPEGAREVLTTKQNRLQVLFLVALLGVLLAIGLAVAGLAGPWVALGYAVVALVLVGVAAGRARAAQERARERARTAAGRSCTCCTTSQHDPVQVI